ncbi:MAG: hypothetical protein JNG88_00140 [Phycisphaerales bacterium]|nr:hypothetical protein [Phycisphaerales bacterium]
MKSKQNGGADSAAQTDRSLIDQLSEALAADALPFPLFPLRPRVSGLYTTPALVLQPPLPHPIPQPLPVPFPPFPPIPQPQPGPDPVPFAQAGNADALDGEIAPIFPLSMREELRLDVDGNFPQHVASGVIRSGLAQRANWIARVTRVSSYRYRGAIFYKEGSVGLIPQTDVEIQVLNPLTAGTRQARVTFSGSGPSRTRDFRYRSSYFHSVEFEFDCAEGTEAITNFQTHSHPNRPAGLANENLTINTVFRRAGFDVSRSGGDGVVPISGAGANARWSDSEMHDAMQTYWSRFANRAQWSMWTFFASLHEQGTSLGGIMFDDIGPNHRQGTSIFEDAFIKNPPSGDPAPAAWVQRMRFWTAVHEMGHAFNLAHSWQKSLGTPWIPLANEPEARSFMNYPYGVSGGQAAFFADFAFRFSDPELLFMRHAPERFVRMGDAAWFDHHGFRNADPALQPNFRLTIRANREPAVLEFLEPCVVELSLTNISDEVQLISEDVLRDTNNILLIIQKDGKPTRQYVPYARPCFRESTIALNPNQTRSDSIFIGAGVNGWDLAEPGRYTVRALIRIDDEDVISNPLVIRVQAPAGMEEEQFASEFLNPEVGRALAFDGTRFFSHANDTLERAVEQFPTRRVATHAAIALAAPKLRTYKLLTIGEGETAMTSAADAGGRIRTIKPDVAAAMPYVELALANPRLAADTLGGIDARYYRETIGAAIEREGDQETADRVRGVLDQRQVASSATPTMEESKGASSAVIRKKIGVTS